MQVTVNLSLSEEDQNELKKILGCSDSELDTSVAPYASAAVEELVTMFLGKKVFNRGSDILEYRLYLMIKHAFSSRIPNEQDVCRLFQTTSSGSRSLIRAVMSKYQYLLKDAIDETLKDCLNSAEVAEGNESVTMAIHNINLVDELNRELAEIDSNLPPVQKKRGSVSTFELKPSAYAKLCERFAVESKLENDE